MIVERMYQTFVNIVWGFQDAEWNPHWALTEPLKRCSKRPLTLNGEWMSRTAQAVLRMASSVYPLLVSAATFHQPTLATKKADPRIALASKWIQFKWTQILITFNSVNQTAHRYPPSIHHLRFHRQNIQCNPCLIIRGAWEREKKRWDNLLRLD